MARYQRVSAKSGLASADAFSAAHLYRPNSAVAVREPRARKRRHARGWLVWPVIAVLFIAAAASFAALRPSQQKLVVIEVLQSNCEGVCAVRLEGWSSDTLRLDWTPSTRRLDVVLVMAAVGKSRPLIYETGIRYFKFPNGSGGYDVVDWANDRTRTVNEMPRRYFPELSGLLTGSRS